MITMLSGSIPDIDDNGGSVKSVLDKQGREGMCR